MKNQISTLITASVLLVSLSAHAQNDKGNGGGGFDCGSSVVVLDTVEGDRRGFHPFF